MKMYDKQNKPLPLRFLVFQQRITSSNKTSSHIKLLCFFPYFDTFNFLSKQKHNNLNLLLLKLLTLFINQRNKLYQQPIIIFSILSSEMYCADFKINFNINTLFIIQFMKKYTTMFFIIEISNNDKINYSNFSVYFLNFHDNYLKIWSWYVKQIYLQNYPLQWMTLNVYFNHKSHTYYHRSNLYYSHFLYLF